MTTYGPDHDTLTTYGPDHDTLTTYGPDHDTLTTYRPDHDTLVLIAYARKMLNGPMLTYPVELEI